MRSFIFKTASVFTFIAAIIVLDNWLIGNLPFIGALALLPAFALLTIRLFTLGIKPAHKKKARSAHSRHAARPALRVVDGGQKPNGPRAA